MTFDSHCHPQFPQYDNDRGEMLKRAQEAGVFMICIGTDLETSKKGIELAQQNKNIWATVGLHPNDTEELSIKNYELGDFEKLISEPKVVAVGEVGLDYYRTPEPDKQEIQKKVFEKFLDVAIQYDKPIVLHSRDASKGSTGKVHSDMIQILNSKCLIHNTKLSGVAHSFTGTLEESRKYLDLGFHLGFNGIITFLPAGRQVRGQYDQIVIHTPLENMLLETDAPYLTPEPHRGQRNEPAYVLEVAKKVAELKGISYEEVVATTTQNTRKLFQISL